jgi:hypothetical protein
MHTDARGNIKWPFDPADLVPPPGTYTGHARPRDTEPPLWLRFIGWTLVGALAMSFLMWAL